MKVVPTTAYINTGQNGYCHADTYKNDEWDMQHIQEMCNKKIHLLSEIGDSNDREEQISLNDINMWKINGEIIPFLNRKLENIDSIIRLNEPVIREAQSNYMRLASEYNTYLTIRARNEQCVYDFGGKAGDVDQAL